MEVLKQEEVANTLADLTLEMFEHCNYKIERMAKSLELNVSEFKTLYSFRNDSKITAGELAKRLSLSNSRLTKIIDGLVEKEIVDRELSNKDRRVMEIELTEKGKIVVEKLRDKYTSTHIEIASHIPEESIDSIIYALRKINSAIKIWEQN